MQDELSRLAEALRDALGEAVRDTRLALGELTVELRPDDLVDSARRIRDEFGFEQLIDLCGVDYLHYGVSEWRTSAASRTGFSRGVQPRSAGRFTFDEAEAVDEAPAQRFAVVYHLLSLQHNRRLRLRVPCRDSDFPTVPSVVPVWNSANWYEREAFDLFGIVFEGHPDLRRILTDYGFVGHPFRKDFPLIGQVEMRYDEKLGRVVYEPVSIEPRVNTPRVVREDCRYLPDGIAPEVAEEEADG